MKEKLARLALCCLLLFTFTVGLVNVDRPALAQQNSSDTLSSNDFFRLRIPIFRTTNEDSFFTLLANIINFVLLLAGIIAFFYVLYGGFLYLTSGGDQAGAQKGRTMIANALIGIVIIFLSYALVNFFVNRLFREGQSGSGASFGTYLAPSHGSPAQS